MRAWIFSAVLAICLTTVSLSARAAEFYLDAYGGVAITEDSDVDVRVGGQKASDTADYGASGSGGFGAGLWWENVPWIGMAQDFSYFRAESDDVEVDVFSISTLLMLRVPLGRSQDFPNGRIFPYAGIGPSLYYARFDADLRPAVSRSESEDSLDVGYQVHTGLQWRLDRRWSLFGEYRFTYRDFDAKEWPGTYGGLTPSDKGADTTLKTHHFLLGVSFWF